VRGLLEQEVLIDVFTAPAHSNSPANSDAETTTAAKAEAEQA